MVGECTPKWKRICKKKRILHACGAMHVFEDVCGCGVRDVDEMHSATVISHMVGVSAGERGRIERR